MRFSMWVGVVGSVVSDEVSCALGSVKGILLVILSDWCGSELLVYVVSKSTQI